ncbi:MAG: Crp/Fnr family transcriptional regulator [Desulfobacteraceae bacterium]|nr:MAG: Crp/Fnr family transcriptional regulator [Desulfobacteraceae bacterium]
MVNLFEIISAVPLFEGLPREQLNELRKITVSRRFTRGETIFSEGDPGNGFFVIAEGLVKIYKVSSEGKEQILHIFGVGEPFGEVPVFTGQPFPANAEALAKSHLLFFPRTDFVELITANPSLSLSMLAVLSMRLRQFTIQIENLSLKEVPGRLASYLIYLAGEQDGNNNIRLKISKNQLASLLGTIPETLSRIFSKMTDMKLIEVEGKNIKLLDRPGLITLSEHGKNQMAS